MTKSELEMAPRYARYAAAIILPRVPASVAASQLIEALKPLGVQPRNPLMLARMTTIFRSNYVLPYGRGNHAPPITTKGEKLCY
jgi:hypothetical protein